MSDIAHISGLVATGEQNNAFLWSDVVTTTTHKSLAGPRSGMIFSRKKSRADGSMFALLSTELQSRFAVLRTVSSEGCERQLCGNKLQVLAHDTRCFIFRDYSCSMLGVEGGVTEAAPYVAALLQLPVSDHTSAYRSNWFP